MMSEKASVAAEAKGLLRLVQKGESVDSIRALIGDGSPQRQATQIAFDLLAAKLSRNRKRVCQRIKPDAVSDSLRKRVARLMQAGWSKKKIREFLPVSWSLLGRIAREVHPAIYKRSMGRRFSSEFREKLCAAIAEGKSPVVIKRELGICYPTIRKYRCAVGDFGNRAIRRKLTPEQLEQATAMLKAGEKWRVVASKFGVGTTRLLVRLRYRKRDDDA
jgi:hypothetical protein